MSQQTRTVGHEILQAEDPLPNYCLVERQKALFEGKESRDSLNKNGCRRNSKEDEKAKHGKFTLTADFLPEI